MKAYRIFIAVVVLFASLTLSFDGSVSAQHHHERSFWADLTDEQRAEIQDTITELRDEGATPEEIRAAVAELLEEFRIEPPDHWGEQLGPRGFGPHRGGFWSELSDEQREAIQTRIIELRDEGATAEEICAAVSELFKEFGIERPEDWCEEHRDGARHGGHGFGDHFWSDLTNEQKTAIRDRIRAMRAQGATREEIRAALAEMLEGWGIGSSESAGPLSSKTPSGESSIVTHNYPNPFNPETYINYTLNAPGMVRIQVYDVTGHVIRSFTVGYQQSGSYSVLWDGCDRRGVPVASGVYFYRIEAGPHAAMNRMVLLR